MAGLVLCMTQACAGPDVSLSEFNISDNAVAAAYETSGAVNVTPYTRTIFSSTNF